MICLKTHLLSRKAGIIGQALLRPDLGFQYLILPCWFYMIPRGGSGNKRNQRCGKTLKY